MGMPDDAYIAQSRIGAVVQFRLTGLGGSRILQVVWPVG